MIWEEIQGLFVQDWEQPGNSGRLNTHKNTLSCTTTLDLVFSAAVVKCVQNQLPYISNINLPPLETQSNLSVRRYVNTYLHCLPSHLF